MNRSHFARLLLPLAALASCADLSQYTRQGADLVSQFGPEVTRLLDGNAAAQDRASKVPATTEGLTQTQNGLNENRDLLTRLKGQLDGLPGKVDSAVKTGNVDELTKLLGDSQKDVSTGVANAAGQLKTLTGQVTQLEGQAAADAAKAKAAAAAAAAVPVEPPSFSKALSSGFTVKGAPNGIEAQLIAFIEDSGKAVDKTTWFNFDRLMFKTGSAEVDLDKSKDQLTNVAEILKAYPKVTLKVGGYTDNQGPAAANKKLSTDRATNVVKALTSMTIAAKRLAPEGYGPEFPACPANDTDDCRAQNRRIAVRVSAK